MGDEQVLAALGCYPNPNSVSMQRSPHVVHHAASQATHAHETRVALTILISGRPGPCAESAYPSDRADERERSILPVRPRPLVPLVCFWGAVVTGEKKSDRVLRTWCRVLRTCFTPRVYERHGAELPLSMRRRLAIITQVDTLAVRAAVAGVSRHLPTVAGTIWQA